MCMPCILTAGQVCDRCVPARSTDQGPKGGHRWSDTDRARFSSWTVKGDCNPSSALEWEDGFHYQLPIWREVSGQFVSKNIEDQQEVHVFLRSWNDKFGGEVFKGVEKPIVVGGAWPPQPCTQGSGPPNWDNWECPQVRPARPIFYHAIACGDAVLREPQGDAVDAAKTAWRRGWGSAQPEFEGFYESCREIRIRDMATASLDTTASPADVKADMVVVRPWPTSRTDYAAAQFTSSIDVAATAPPRCASRKTPTARRLLHPLPERLLRTQQRCAAPKALRAVQGGQGRGGAPPCPLATPQGASFVRSGPETVLGEAWRMLEAGQ